MPADSITVPCLACHLGHAHGCDGPSDWTAADVLDLAESAHQSEHSARIATIKIASREAAIARLETTVTAQLSQIRTLTAEVERLRGEGMKVAS